MNLDPFFQRSMWRYRSWLPAIAGEPVTLGEGRTPLIASRLFEDLTLFWKDETRNPTGSHKDRALSLAATDAKAKRARTMVVVSAGSTGLSNAAYAARARMKSVAVVSAGVPKERLYPLHALGARIVTVDAPIDQLIDAVSKLSGKGGIYVASTTQAANPVQAEAARTIAYEIVDELGRAPDAMIVPVGGGGTIAAIHRGFEHLRQMGQIARLPKLFAVVPSRYNALQVSLNQGIESAECYFSMPSPAGGPTILNKIAHDHPPDGVEALRALRVSRGGVVCFDDEEAKQAVAQIGAADGLYFEPSTAIVLPAMKQLFEAGSLRPGDIVVALGCGSGFRETSVMLDSVPTQLDAICIDDLERQLCG